MAGGKPVNDKTTLPSFVGSQESIHASENNVHARPAALAVALLCSVTLPAQAYDQLYVFGDSLSDTGNNGRFTYDGNQHLLYDEALAQRIGAALVASDNGGENYAAGGRCGAGPEPGRQHPGSGAALPEPGQRPGRRRRAVYSLDRRQRSGGGGAECRYRARRGL